MNKLEIAKAIKEYGYECGDAMGFDCSDCPGDSLPYSECHSQKFINTCIAEHEEKPMYEKVAIEGKPDWCELGVRVKTAQGIGYISGYDASDIKLPFRIILDSGTFCWVKTAEPITKWQPREGEAVMAWEDDYTYFRVIAHEGMINYTHIAKYDGRLDLRVSEIGPEVPRLK